VSAEIVDSTDTTERVDGDATLPEPGVALYDLKPNQCLYAVAEPMSRFHLFCAAATQLGKAFCPVHQALCYPTIAARNALPEPQDQRRRKSALASRRRSNDQPAGKWGPPEARDEFKRSGAGE
jgi:hypothetical protein